MCEPIHSRADVAVDGLPVLAELVQYPPTLDGPEGDALAELLSEVASERVAQDRQWGGPAHDDRHAPADWYGILYSLLDRLVDCGGGATEAYRVQLIKIAAVAIAAARSWDRTTATRKDVSAKADRAQVEYQLRAAVGQLLTPTRVADAVAPSAQLRRLGFAVPEFEALEHAIHLHWGIPVTINTDCTIAAVADVVCDGLNRRNAA